MDTSTDTTRAGAGSGQRPWTLLRCTFWACVLLAGFLVYLAFATSSAGTVEWMTGGLASLTAGAALVAAIPRPRLALVLLVVSALPGNVPGWISLVHSTFFFLHPAIVMLTLLVVALRTFLVSPSSEQRRLVQLSSATAVLYAALVAVSATAITQVTHQITGRDPFWSTSGLNYVGDASGRGGVSGFEALWIFGLPFFLAYLVAAAAALVLGWAVSLILAARSGELQVHPWPLLSRWATGLQRPRVLMTVLLALGGVIMTGLSIIGTGSSPLAIVYTSITVGVMCVGAAFAPLRPRLALALVGAACVIGFLLGLFAPAWSGQDARYAFTATVLALLVVLVFAPAGRSWWATAAAMVLLGAALLAPPTAQHQAFIPVPEVSSAEVLMLAGPAPSEAASDAQLSEYTTRLNAAQAQADAEASNRAYADFQQAGPLERAGGFPGLLAGFLTVLPLFLLPAVLAWGIRLTASVATERRRLAQARAALKASEESRALSEERRGIAGDVHDVLAHSLTVIVAQGEGALVSSGGAQQDAVRRMVDVARASLRDVRALIERLDGEDTELPSPGLDNLPALIQNVRDAGLSLHSEELGERLPLGDSGELALYRILQEALTNVLTHGGRGASARLILDWRGDAPGLTFTLASVGAPGSAPHPGTGLGLEGMRTRAAVAGGWLTAGPDDAFPGSAGSVADDAAGADDEPGRERGAGPAASDQAASSSGNARPVWLVTAHLPAVEQKQGALR